MTEHEQLKWICDTIGYRFNSKDIWYNWKFFWYMEEYIPADVRQIIFTSEFKNKFIEYNTSIIMDTRLPKDLVAEVYFMLVLSYLDDPVSYLYNLLQWQ